MRLPLLVLAGLGVLVIAQLVAPVPARPVWYLTVPTEMQGTPACTTFMTSPNYLYSVSVGGLISYANDPRLADAGFRSDVPRDYFLKHAYPWAEGQGLLVNGLSPTFGASPNDRNQYDWKLIGTGKPFCFMFMDSYYPDNKGSFSVTISQLWP